MIGKIDIDAVVECSAKGFETPVCTTVRDAGEQPSVSVIVTNVPGFANLVIGVRIVCGMDTAPMAIMSVEGAAALAQMLRTAIQEAATATAQVLQ